MKSKLLSRILSQSQKQTIICSQSCDSKLRRYSKPFVELMEKAIHQLRSKQTKQKKNQSFSYKSYQSFVQGLFPSHQKKISHKARNNQRSQLNVGRDLCCLEKIQSISTKNQDNQKNLDSSAFVKQNRYRQNFHIKQRKAFQIYKKMNVNRFQNETKMSQKEYEGTGQGKSHSKFNGYNINKLIDQHIQPWSIVQDNQFLNRYQFQ